MGEEALAPATDQLAVAAFAYEELDFGRWQLQFGGRLERNGYTVGERADHDDHNDPPTVRDRDFLGGSASMGLRGELTPQTVVVVNLTQSHRASSTTLAHTSGISPMKLATRTLIQKQP